jgi:hypothetical protein
MLSKVNQQDFLNLKKIQKSLTLKILTIPQVKSGAKDQEQPMIFLVTQNQLLKKNCPLEEEIMSLLRL